MTEPRGRRLLVGAIAAFALVFGGTVITLRYQEPVVSAGGTAVVPHARPVPPRADGDARMAAVEALLERRAAAVRDRDRAGFIATVDAGQSAFRAAQGRLFDALASVPFAVWSYEADFAGPARRVPSPDRYSGAETYSPSVVVLHYRLAGYDDRPGTTRQYLTFVRHGKSWFLGSDSDFERANVHTVREIWDFGPVVTVQGRRSLVLGHPTDKELLRRLSAEADRDVPRVTDVWGTGWPQRVVIVVPASQTELARILDRPSASLSRIAAVATADVTDGRGLVPAAANRIVVNPRNVAQLGPLGRRIVVTHEMTHVATRSTTTSHAPTWLVEGFADYVAYASSGIPTAVSAHELKEDVDSGRLPVTLPTDADFSGTSRRLPQAYEGAWLACRLIARRAGEAGLLRFYRTVAAASATDADVRLATALRTVLDSTPASFEAAWRSYLRSELG